MFDIMNSLIHGGKKDGNRSRGWQRIKSRMRKFERMGDRKFQASICFVRTPERRIE